MGECLGQAFSDKSFSARTTALGRAAVSLAGDPSLVFYNSASNGNVERLSIASSYTNLYPNVEAAGLNFIALAAAYPLPGVGVVGLGVTQFSPTGWAENTVVGNFASTFLHDDLSLGASFKFLHWKASEPEGENAVPEPALSYNGFSLDIGATYVVREVTRDNDVRVGLSIQNINQPSVASNGSKDADLPFGVTGGLSYVSRTYNYLVTAQMSKFGDELVFGGGAELVGLESVVFGVAGKFLVRFGGSTAVADFSFIRTGGGEGVRFFRGDQLRGEYNAGFGIHAGGLVIDYSFAMQALVSSVGGINTISIGYTF